MDSETIKRSWLDFIAYPLSKSNHKNNHDLMMSDFGGLALTSSQIKSYKDINDSVKEEIIYRIVHMLDQNNFFEVIVGNPIPPFALNQYKSKE